MIVELKSPFEKRLDYDFCIVGSGPAGLTLCSEITRRSPKSKILVLESGFRHKTAFADSLKKTSSEGIQITECSRERLLGGASTTWSGLSSPLDPIDYVKRDWVPYSGWPIEEKEMSRFYDIASNRYGFPSRSFYNLGKWEHLDDESSTEIKWGELSEKVFLAPSGSIDFGKKLKHLFDSENVDLLLDATVTKLITTPNGGSIQSVQVSNSNKDSFCIEAKTFVLACGGIENPRLLLNSVSKAHPNGLGNDHDQVGRYLMNHPKNYHGIIKLKKGIRKLPKYFGFLYNDVSGYIGLRINEETQKNKRILNSYIRLEPIYPWSDNEGVEALVFILKKARILMKSFMFLNRNKVVELVDYSETGDDSRFSNQTVNLKFVVTLILLIFRNFRSVSWYFLSRVLDRSRIPTDEIRIRNLMEMEPSQNNRVMLGEELDEFGSFIPFVSHSTTELDKKSLIAIHETLADHLKQIDLGVFESSLDLSVSDWPINLDASHHMGTTRMGENAANSVVDRHAKLHSIDNLYMAGSSVFPTSGNVNPTYTIVALSIRLAEHLCEFSNKSK